MYESISHHIDNRKPFIHQSYDVKKTLNISSFHTFCQVHYDYKYSFIGERHNFWECVYVISGNAIATSDDKIYNLTSNDIIFHKPLEFHNLQIDDTNGSDILIFSFTDDSEFMNYFNNKVFKLSSFQVNTISCMLEFLHSIYIPKRKYMNPTLKNFLDCLSTSETLLYSASLYIELLFLQLYEQPNLLVLSNSTRTDAILFKEAVNFMNTNIDNNLSIPQIAKHCHVSSSTLKQTFSKYANLSVHQYFLLLKITNATKLLKSGKSPSTVAELLGFSSPSYFSTIYKRETGSSPSSITPKG